METNIHHFAWDRADYKTRLEKLFRGHRLMRVLMYVPPHIEIHDAIKPVDKPSEYQMQGAIAVLDNMYTATPTEVLEELAGQMRGRPSLVDHFLRQIPFVERGQAWEDVRYG